MNWCERIRSRMAGGERRHQILQVAMQLFADRGFRGTTTKEIANAAGVSEAMVFRHFANKEALYSAILDFKAECHHEIDPMQLLTDLIETRDDFQIFYKLALHVLEHHDHDVLFIRLMLHSALEQHKLSELFFERFVAEYYNKLSSYIELRQSEGAFRNMNPRIAVRTFIGMIIHHSMNNKLFDVQRRLLNISNEEAAREFAQILLRGISA